MVFLRPTLSRRENPEAVTGDFAFEVAQSNSAEAARIAAGPASDAASRTRSSFELGPNSVKNSQKCL